MKQPKSSSLPVTLVCVIQIILLSLLTKSSVIASPFQTDLVGDEFKSVDPQLRYQDLGNTDLGDTNPDRRQATSPSQQEEKRRLRFVRRNGEHIGDEDAFKRFANDKRRLRFVRRGEQASYNAVTTREIRTQRPTTDSRVKEIIYVPVSSDAILGVQGSHNYQSLLHKRDAMMVPSGDGDNIADDEEDLKSKGQEDPEDQLSQVSDISENSSPQSLNPVAKDTPKMSSTTRRSSNSDGGQTSIHSRRRRSALFPKTSSNDNKPKRLSIDNNMQVIRDMLFRSLHERKMREHNNLRAMILKAGKRSAPQPFITEKFSDDPLYLPGIEGESGSGSMTKRLSVDNMQLIRGMILRGIYERKNKEIREKDNLRRMILAAGKRSALGDESGSSSMTKRLSIDNNMQVIRDMLFRLERKREIQEMRSLNRMLLAAGKRSGPSSSTFEPHSDTQFLPPDNKAALYEGGRDFSSSTEPVQDLVNDWVD